MENILCKGRTPGLKAMKPKTSEAASADYTDLSVSMLTCTVNFSLTIGDLDMSWRRCFIKLELPVLAANPRILFICS